MQAPPCMLHVHHNPCALTSQDALHAEHESYLQEVGLGSRTQNLEPLMRVLQAQGQTVVSPTERALLHPLAIPLAKGPAPPAQTANAALRRSEAYTCLLQYSVGSSAGGGGLPIVQMSSEALAVALLARNPDEYLHRSDSHWCSKRARLACTGLNRAS